MIKKLAIIFFFSIPMRIFPQDPPAEFECNTSSLQAYYFAVNASICGGSISTDDWIGAFSPRDICVGSVQWNGAYNTDIPVRGDDGDPETEGYMLEGEVPYFKIWDASSGPPLGLYFNTNSPSIPYYNMDLPFIDYIDAIGDPTVLEITYITIANVSSPSLTINAYENEFVNITISIVNNGGYSTCPTTLGVKYSDSWTPPFDEPASYNIILNIEGLAPGGNIDVPIPNLPFGADFNYGQNAISAKINPPGGGGAFFSGADPNNLKYVGWVELSEVTNYIPPVPTQNWALTSVVNEYRNTNRIHQGIDIAAAGGSDVSSVSSGRIVEVNTACGAYDPNCIADNNPQFFVSLEDFDSNANKGFRYFHIRKIDMSNSIPVFSYSLGDWIYTAGAVFASVWHYTGVPDYSGPPPDYPYISWGAHIHLDDYTSGNGLSNIFGTPKNFASNPLRLDGIDQTHLINNDTTQPLVLDTLTILQSGVGGLPDKYDNCIQNNMEIDFVVYVRDENNNGLRLGVASIAFQIWEVDPSMGVNQQIYPATAGNWELRVELQDTPSDYVFYQEISNIVPYLYCGSDCRDNNPYYTDPATGNSYVRCFLTNYILDPEGVSPTYPGYINTIDITGADGLVMDDGEYVLRVRVEDFAGNAPTIHEFPFCVNDCPVIIRGEKNE